MQGRRTHLPDIEPVGIDTSQCMFILLLYRFLQDHPPSHTVGFFENPTPELDLVIFERVLLV